MPAAACLLVLPAERVLGPHALVARFQWHRAQYEQLAIDIRNGQDPDKLHLAELGLARWAKVMRALDLEESLPTRRNYSSSYDPPLRPDYAKIVGVHFLTVTHSFAGHVGFMRVFDDEASRHLAKGHGADGWSFSKRLDAGWYLVAD